MATYNADGPGPARLNIAPHVSKEALEMELDVYRLGTVDGTNTIDPNEEADFNADWEKWSRKFGVAHDYNELDWDCLILLRRKVDGKTLVVAQRGDA